MKSKPRDLNRQVLKTNLPDHAIDRMVVMILCLMDSGTPHEALELRVSLYSRASPIYDDEKTVAWWEGVDDKQIRINHRPLISLKRVG